MADLFKIGLSGLRAAQTNLSVTGQNITNVNTPGYTRQTAVQTTSPAAFTGAGYLGSGTKVVDIQRIYNQFLTNQVRTTTSRSEEHTSELQSRPHLVCRLLLEKKKSDSSPSNS